MTFSDFIQSFGIQMIFWLVNVATFCIYAWDKRRALLRQSRIPEALLLVLACIGGGVGALCAMFLFRHKIHNPKFYITVPIVTALQLIAYGFLLWLGAY